VTREQGKTNSTVVSRLASEWRGGGVELSEFHEGVVERVDDRYSLVPHQPWNILRRRKGKVGEVSRIIQR
jgi:hypothetical protein